MRQMVDAVVGQLRQQAVQRDRIGRGEGAGIVQLARDDAEGAEAGGLASFQRPELAREGDGGGLAAGAGDRGDALRLVAEKARRDQRERAARLLGGQHGDALRQIGEFAAFRRQDRGRAGLHRRRHEAAAVEPCCRAARRTTRRLSRRRESSARSRTSVSRVARLAGADRRCRESAHSASSGASETGVGFADTFRGVGAAAAPNWVGAGALACLIPDCAFFEDGES